MKNKIDFAILAPDKNDKNICALVEFLERYDLKVGLLPYASESLNQVVEAKIGSVILFNKLESRFAVHFIVEASLKKIFKSTSFYYLSYDEVGPDEKVKLMTLGFLGFIRFPFSVQDVQNTIDLFESTLKMLG